MRRRLPLPMVRRAAGAASAAVVGCLTTGCGDDGGPLVAARVYDVTAAEVPEGPLRAARATAEERTHDRMVIVAFEEAPCLTAQLRYCTAGKDTRPVSGEEAGCNPPAGEGKDGHARLEVTASCEASTSEHPWVVERGELFVERDTQRLRVRFDAALNGEGSFGLFVDAMFEPDDIESSE